MYYTRENSEVVETIKDFFDYFPDCIPEFIRFYHAEFQDDCPDLKGISIQQIISDKNLLGIAIKYLNETETDIWDFTDTFSSDLKGEYDLIDWDDYDGGLQIVFFNIYFTSKEDYLSMFAKKWAEYKPTQEEIIGALVEKQL